MSSPTLLVSLQTRCSSLKNTSTPKRFIRCDKTFRGRMKVLNLVFAVASICRFSNPLFTNLPKSQELASSF